MKKIILFGAIIFLCAAAHAKNLRIISLQPSNTEIVYALGAGDSLVGVSSFCNYPPEVQSKEKVGDFINPNIEKIISLKPDVILAGKWQTSQIVPRLKKANLNVVEIDLPTTLEEIYSSIDQISKVIGRVEEGKFLVHQLTVRSNRVISQARKRKVNPKIYIHIDRPNWTVSKLSFISDVVERCGTVNIFRDLPVAGAEVSVESLIEKNPDVILEISNVKDRDFTQRAGWNQINAVKNKRIIEDIVNDVIVRPTPRVVDGMEQLSKKISELGYE